MADVATPSAAKVATSSEKQQVVKPEQPDEAKYKEDLAKAEKEHTAAQEKFVSALQTPLHTNSKYSQARDANIRSLYPLPATSQPVAVCVC
jgi:hypothetical protein